MKRVLFLILGNGAKSLHALEEINSHGFNGTLVGGASLRHTLEGKLPEEHSFFHLAQWEADNKKESTVSIFIENEEQLEELKKTIRKYTDNFKSVKGAFFTIPLEDYEGTF